MNKFGIIIGRYQPFHIAHEAMIHEIIADGRTPIVLLGSSNVINEKNPYTVDQRVKMLHAVFPDLWAIPINDCETDELWAEQLQDVVRFIATESKRFSGLDKTDIVWYTNFKEKDKSVFEYKGRLYSYYTGILKEMGFIVKAVSYPKLLNLEIDASDIRKDLEAHKHYLDGRVYKQLKELNNVKSRLSYYK